MAKLFLLISVISNNERRCLASHLLGNSLIQWRSVLEITVLSQTLVVICGKATMKLSAFFLLDAKVVP